jgi:hypothetical protein
VETREPEVAAEAAEPLMVLEQGEALLKVELALAVETQA